MRQLWWMARGAWQHTATVACAILNIARSFGGKDSITPDRLNPFRRPVVRTPEQIEDENDLGWDTIKVALTHHVRK